MAKTNNNYEFLTTAPVPRVIGKMAAPAMVSMLMTSFYNMADTYFVGKISTQATAAVGVSFALMSVIQAIGFFFGQGAGTYISRELGARNVRHAEEMASFSFFVAIASGIVLMVLGLCFLTPLSIALGSTPTILPSTKEFLVMVLMGTPFMIGSMVLNNQMKFQGNANYAMFGMLSGGIVNLILVPLFIFGMNLGVFGAGLGTFIGQVCGFVVLLIMSHMGGNIIISPTKFRATKRYVREVFRGGTPSLTRQGLAAISTSVLNLAAGAYGDAAIAGVSIVSRISFLILSAVIGLGHGFQPFCGFNYGAGNNVRIKQGYYFCLKVSMLGLLGGIAICFPLATPIVTLFRHDADVIAVAAATFRWQMVTYPLVAFVTLSNMMMQTMGKSLSANLVAAARNGICFIPMILLFSHWFGLKGIEMCQSASDVLTFLVTAVLTVHLIRHSLRSKN